MKYSTYIAILCLLGEAEAYFGKGRFGNMRTMGPKMGMGRFSPIGAKVEGKGEGEGESGDDESDGGDECPHEAAREKYKAMKEKMDSHKTSSFKP